MGMNVGKINFFKCIRVSLLFADDTTLMSRGRILQKVMEVAVRDFRNVKD